MRITVMLEYFHPWPNSAGFYVARQNEHYRQAGLEVVFTTFDRYWGGSEDHLLRGDVVFALSPSKRVVTRYEQGVPLRGIALINHRSFEAIQTLRSKGITRPRDLAGKRVSLHPTKKGVAMLRHIVRQDGGDADSVLIIDSGERQLQPEELQSGIADATYGGYWAWEALMSSSVPAEDRLVWKADEIGAPVQPGYVLTAHEETLRKNPAMVRAFLAATEQGYRDAAADPDSAAAVYEQVAPYFDTELIKASLSAVTPTWFHDNLWGQQRIERAQPYIDWLTSHNIISRTDSWERAMTNAFLPSAT